MAIAIRIGFKGTFRGDLKSVISIEFYKALISRIVKEKQIIVNEVGITQIGFSDGDGAANDSVDFARVLHDINDVKLSASFGHDSDMLIGAVIGCESVARRRASVCKAFKFSYCKTDAVECAFHEDDTILETELLKYERYRVDD